MTETKEGVHVKCLFCSIPDFRKRSAGMGENVFLLTLRAIRGAAYASLLRGGLHHGVQAHI